MSDTEKDMYSIDRRLSFLHDHRPEIPKKLPRCPRSETMSRKNLLSDLSPEALVSKKSPIMSVVSPKLTTQIVESVQTRSLIPFAVSVISTGFLLSANIVVYPALIRIISPFAAVLFAYTLGTCLVCSLAALGAIWCLQAKPRKVGQLLTYLGLAPLNWNMVQGVLTVYGILLASWFITQFISQSISDLMSLPSPPLPMSNFVYKDVATSQIYVGGVKLTKATSLVLRLALSVLLLPPIVAEDLLFRGLARATVRTTSDLTQAVFFGWVFANLVFFRPLVNLAAVFVLTTAAINWKSTLVPLSAHLLFTLTVIYAMGHELK